MPAIPEWSIAAQAVGKAAARHVLHHQIRAAVGFAITIDPDDVREFDRRHGPCFANEPRPCRRLARQAIRDQLDRDDAIESLVTGEIHVPHAAAAQGAKHVVTLDVWSV